MLTRLCSPACMLVLLTSASAQSTPEAPIARTELRRVVFENAALLSAEEQKQLSRQIHEESPEDQVSRIGSDIAEQAAGWVREAYQDKSYFGVQVSAKFKLISAQTTTRQADIEIDVRKSGPRYRLRSIGWENMNVFTRPQLDSVASLHPDEIFSRRDIVTALEDIRKLYGSHGYINMTCIPNTIVDDANATIALDMDIDQGDQFVFASARVLRIDQRPNPPRRHVSRFTARTAI